MTLGTCVRFILAVLLVSALPGCLGTQSSSDSDSLPSASDNSYYKPIASEWELSTTGAWSLDLRAARFDGVEFNAIVKIRNTASQCTCGIRFSATLPLGDCTLSTPCHLTGGTDPGCTLSDGNPYGLCGPDNAYRYDSSGFSFYKGHAYR
jgi:hypothetical protein